jgi:hypothetical protein
MNQSRPTLRHQRERIRHQVRELGGSRRQVRKVMRRCRRRNSIPFFRGSRGGATSLQTTASASGERNAIDKMSVCNILGWRTGQAVFVQHFEWGGGRVKDADRAKVSGGANLLGALSSTFFDGVKDRGGGYRKWNGHKKGAHWGWAVIQWKVAIAGVGEIGKRQFTMGAHKHYDGSYTVVK